MIEINLLEKKKKFRLPVVIGIDLNEVKWVPLIIAYMFNIIADSYIFPILDGGVPELKAQISPLNKRLKKIKRENRKNKGLSEILGAFEKQITKLKERELEVSKVMKLRTNPKNILASISKIVPDDLWLNTMSVSDDKKIYIEGAAISYQSVGKLIIKANELEFFGGSITIKDSTTEEVEIKGVKYRLQKFKLEGNIISFGML